MTGALLAKTTGERARPTAHTPREGRSRPFSEEQHRQGPAGRAQPMCGASDPSCVPIILAGANAESRLAMLGELRNLLPADTDFLEASETWELLALAQGSRMVVLVDDLGDVSSASLVRLLGRRHPGLPVLAVEGRAGESGRPGAGSASA